MVQWTHIVADRIASATTVNVTNLSDLSVTVDHEKYGSLVICFPIAVFLGLAWTFHYFHKQRFHTDGVAYISLVAISFCACSISMHTLNKVCVSLTGAPSTLTTVQMCFTAIATLAYSGREVLGADRRKLLSWMVVPVMYAGMLNSSLLGYQYLSLSLVTVFRNLAPLLTMLVEGFIVDAENRPKVTLPAVLSLLTMVVGAVVYSFGQASSTWLGLCLVTLNTLLAIGDRLLQRRLLVAECKGLPLSACMTLNNTLGMLPTLAMAFATHEIDGYRSHNGAWTDPSTLVLIALSGCMGLCIGYFGLMCQKAMTATSFQVMQNMAKVPVVMVGIFVFGDRMDSPSRMCGMALSLIGSAAYGLAKASEAVQPPALVDAAASKGEGRPLLAGCASPFSEPKDEPKGILGNRVNSSFASLAYVKSVLGLSSDAILAKS